MKTKIIATFTVLAFAALLLLGATSSRVSDYPATLTMNSTYLFWVANPGVTNYSLSWSQLTNLVQNLTANFGSNTVRSVKSPFHTNYTATTADDVLLVYGSNQLITLPSCTVATVGKQFCVTCTNVDGSFVVTNATGAQKIRTTEDLAFTNTAIGSATFVNSGDSWWMIGRSQ